MRRLSETTCSQERRKGTEEMVTSITVPGRLRQGPVSQGRPRKLEVGNSLILQSSTWCPSPVDKRANHSIGRAAYTRSQKAKAADFQLIPGSFSWCRRAFTF